MQFRGRPSRGEDRSPPGGHRPKHGCAAEGLQGRPVRVRRDHGGFWNRAGSPSTPASSRTILPMRPALRLWDLHRARRFGQSRPLLELPCTTGFIGAGPRLRSRGCTGGVGPWLQPTRAVGILARAGVLNQVMLSGGQHAGRNARAHARAARRRLAHIRDARSTARASNRLHALRDQRGRARSVSSTIDDTCDFFFSKLGGTPTTARFKTLIGPVAVTQLPSCPVNQLPSCPTQL